MLATLRPCDALWSRTEKSNPCILWTIHMEQKDSGERMKQPGEGKKSNGVDWIIELKECSWGSVFISFVLRSLQHHPPHKHTDPSTSHTHPSGVSLSSRVLLSSVFHYLRKALCTLSKSCSSFITTNLTEKYEREHRPVLTKISWPSNERWVMMTVGAAHSSTTQQDWYPDTSPLIMRDH